jgi:hypothetical protein
MQSEFPDFRFRGMTAKNEDIIDGHFTRHPDLKSVDTPFTPSV